MNFPDSILYFPGIEFASPSWVKAALLIWDRVYRIVPEDYDPQDSATVREAVGAGLIHNIVLEADDLKSTYNEFQGFLKQLSFMPAGLESQAPSHAVKKNKIDARLYPILDTLVTRQIGDDWFHLPVEVARGYMFFLAQNVARRRGLYRGTDSPDAWVTSYYFSENGNFGELLFDETADGQLMYLSFRDLIPITVCGVPMKSVVDFVNKRGDEKKQFREQIDTLLARLATCTSDSHVPELLQSFRNDLLSAKADLRSSMGFASLTDLSAILTVALPVAGTVLGAIMSCGGHLDFETLSQSLGCGSVAAYARYSEVCQGKRAAHSGAYLLDLEKKLGPEGKPYYFDRLMNEFVND